MCAARTIHIEQLLCTRKFTSCSVTITILLSGLFFLEEGAGLQGDGEICPSPQADEVPLGIRPELSGSFYVPHDACSPGLTIPFYNIHTPAGGRHEKPWSSHSFVLMGEQPGP